MQEERSEIRREESLKKYVMVILFDESNRIFMCKFNEDLWKDKWSGSCLGLVKGAESAEESVKRSVENSLNFRGKLTNIGEKAVKSADVNGEVSVFVGRGKEVFPNSEHIYESEWFGLMDAEDMIKRGECTPLFAEAVKMLGL